MPNIIDEIDISKIEWKNDHFLPLWVYGTLREGKRFNYYLDGCSDKVGEYQMEGTLMQMVSGDVFVRKDGSGLMVTGELYRVSLTGLWRIFHLENQSSSFPKAYDLTVSRIFETASGSMDVALWFRRRDEEPLPVQDYNKHKTLLENMMKFMKARDPKSADSDINKFLLDELNKLVQV